VVWAWLACVPGSQPQDDTSRDTVRDSRGFLSDTSIERVPGAQHPALDPTRIIDIELQMAAADWSQVRDNPWTKEWVHAELTAGDTRIQDIGVRAFGAGSLRAGKPSLKLSFDRHTAGQEWAGLDELKLDNSSQDPGYLNEFVATSALRRAGIPASRTGWARVSVNGVYAGFFVVLESVDDRYVERWFGHQDGPLYSMNAHNWGQGLNPMTDPLTWYEPETSWGGDGQGLAAAAQALATGVDVDAHVDVDGFFRESVARSVMGSLDSFSADGNNFYLFVDDGQVRILPWDFDVDLGGYYTTTALTVNPRSPWTTSPWSYNSHSGTPYTDPVLLYALEQGHDPDALIQELLAGPLAWTQMDQDAQTAAALIRDAVHEDVFGVGASFDVRRHGLRQFLHDRWSGLLGRDAGDCGASTMAPLDPQGTVGWGTLDVDRTPWGPGFIVAGEHACSGVFAHAPSTVSIQVQDGTLQGGAGIQDWHRVCGDGAQFQVIQDGAVLWDSGVVQMLEPAVAWGPLDVHAGVVELVALPVGDYTCDTTAWVDVTQ
jgi:hypothetical protein